MADAGGWPSWRPNMANLVDPLAPDVPAWAFCLLLTLEVVVELLAAMYLADVVSGLVHLHLDYAEGKNDELKLVTFKSAEEIIRFKENDEMYKSANKNDQFLWNFHAHHDVAYPAFDPISEQIGQSVRPGSIPYIGSIFLWAIGIMPSWFARVWIVGLTFSFLSQFTHFAAHARSRGLITNPYWGPAVRWMQDWHIIIHPAVHKVHHVHFDRDFCVFNGWANPLLNRLRQLGSRVGYFPKLAPTVTVRAARSARDGADARTYTAPDGDVAASAVSQSGPDDEKSALPADKKSALPGRTLRREADTAPLRAEDSAFENVAVLV